MTEQPEQVRAWADSLLETAESWPDDGPHLQPKQFVRAFHRQVLALQAELRQAEQREQKLQTVAEAAQGYVNDRALLVELVEALAALQEDKPA